MLEDDIQEILFPREVLADRVRSSAPRSTGIMPASGCFS
jgi:hypothetical protein